MSQLFLRFISNQGLVLSSMTTKNSILGVLHERHHANLAIDQKMLPMCYNKYINNLYLNINTMKTIFCVVAIMCNIIFYWLWKP